MRFVANIPHERLAITVFEWNERYIIKLEGGPMEQTFKLEKTQIKGLEEIKKLLSPTFIDACIERFNAMHKDLVDGIKSL